MTRNRPYSIGKANDLISKLCLTSSTVANTDIVGITSDPKYQENLIKQEVEVTSGGGLLIKDYRYDKDELPIGSPFNQTISKIAVSSGTASITALPNSPDEHWLPRLPQRVCEQLECGSCSMHAILPTSGPMVPCCLAPWVSGTVVSLEKSRNTRIDV